MDERTIMVLGEAAQFAILIRFFVWLMWWPRTSTWAEVRKRRLELLKGPAGNESIDALAANQAAASEPD